MDGPFDAEHVAAIERVLQAGKDTGKASFIYCATEQDAQLRY